VTVKCFDVFDKFHGEIPTRRLRVVGEPANKPANPGLYGKLPLERRAYLCVTSFLMLLAAVGADSE